MARESLRTVKIRMAAAGDKGPVLAFCRNTWPSGDYIPSVWDEWLKDKKGRLVVATVDGTPVGVAHAYFQTKDVAWLEGVRVNPHYRGHGIAGRLNRALTSFAEENGATVARLCTGSSNLASRRHIRKVGFKLLQVFARLDCTRGLLRRPPGIAKPNKFKQSFWDLVGRSREYSQFRGLYSDGWTFYPLTMASLRRVVNEHRVLVTRTDRKLSSFTILVSEDRWLTLGFAAGHRESVQNQARYLRYMMRRGRLEKVRAIVPQDSQLADVLKQSGYEQTTKVLVYEKMLHSK